MSEVERIACPNCGGAGCFDDQVAVCCGNVLPSGECCSMPVGEHVQYPCGQCEGSGLRVRQWLQENDDG